MQATAVSPSPTADKPQSAGLVSILITCCGQLEYTKLCVASVLKHSRRPFELIFLDVGSLDGTRELIAGIALATTQSRVEVVRTPSDLGIGDAAMDAVKLTRGDYIVLLNNDVVVTEGWLNQMAGLAFQNASVGLVGPMSNYAPPGQLVEKVPYRMGPKKGARSEWLVDPSAIDAFAVKWREKHKGQWESADRLGGFCLLIKREVLKRTGNLRESSDLGLFDTDLLCASARKAGFTLVGVSAGAGSERERRASAVQPGVGSPAREELSRGAGGAGRGVGPGPDGAVSRPAVAEAQRGGSAAGAATSAGAPFAGEPGEQAQPGGRVGGAKK